MKKYILFLIFIFNTDFAFSNVSKPNDTLSSINNYNISTTQSSEGFVDEDFNLFLLGFALVVTAFVILLMGSGAVITIIFLGIIFAFTTFGILTTSILIGIKQKSFQKGFKSFMIILCGIGGLIFGTFALWIWNKVTHWWTLKTTILFGVSGGLIGGILFGLVSTLILQKIGTFLLLKFEDYNTTKND